MADYTLSKSTFIRSLQCSKSLYLNKYYPGVRDPLPPERAAVFKRGHQVGDLARDLFPGGIDVTPKKRFDFDAASKDTRIAIKNKQEVIYEATFIADGVLVMLDILNYRNGKWYAIEVKSSLKISPTYIRDAALQYFVITKSGLKLEQFSLVHLNSQYHLQGELDISELFSIADVTDTCIEQQEYIDHHIETAKNVLKSGHIPTIHPGEHCFKPYTCDFTHHCNAARPQKESDNEFLSIPDKTVFMHVIYVRPAIPRLENSRPYEHIPVEWTIFDGKEIKQFLFNQFEDPRDEFIKQLNQLEKDFNCIITDDTYALSTFTEMEVLKFTVDYNSLTFANAAQASLSYDSMVHSDDLFLQMELQEGLKEHSKRIVMQMSEKVHE